MNYLTIFFPLTFLISIFPSSLALIISSKNRWEKSCLLQSQAIQTSHQNHTQALMSLNHVAKLLRLERKAAERALKSSSTPHQASVATIWLAKVKAKQNLFVARQNKILNSSRATSKKWVNRTRAKGYVISGHPKKLYLKPYPKNSASPSYRRESSYSKKKIVTLSKQAKLEIPFFFKSQLNGSYRQICKSSIFRRTNQWLIEFATDSP